MRKRIKRIPLTHKAPMPLVEADLAIDINELAKQLVPENYDYECSINSDKQGIKLSVFTKFGNGSEEIVVNYMFSVVELQQSNNYKADIQFAIRDIVKRIDDECDITAIQRSEIDNKVRVVGLGMDDREKAGLRNELVQAVIKYNHDQKLKNMIIV